MAEPAIVALYLTAREIRDTIPGRSDQWIYKHMTLAGGRGGLGFSWHRLARGFWQSRYRGKVVWLVRSGLA